MNSIPTNDTHTARGSEFKHFVKLFFAQRGLNLESEFPVLIGAGAETRQHCFDLGSAAPPVLLECKCHTWTAGGNSPSAKLTIWNEAMYFFALAPRKYRKIFAAVKDMRADLTLSQQYLRLFKHLVPPAVEIWEFDTARRTAACVFTGR